MGLSVSHILLVLVIILIVFGAGKLPKVMGDLAKGFKAFKQGLSDEESEIEDRAHSLEAPKPSAAPRKRTPHTISSK